MESPGAINREIGEDPSPNPPWFYDPVFLARRFGRSPSMISVFDAMRDMTPSITPPGLPRTVDMEDSSPYSPSPVLTPSSPPVVLPAAASANADASTSEIEQPLFSSFFFEPFRDPPFWGDDEISHSPSSIRPALTSRSPSPLSPLPSSPCSSRRSSVEIIMGNHEMYSVHSELRSSEAPSSEGYISSSPAPVLSTSVSNANSPSSTPTGASEDIHPTPFLTAASTSRLSNYMEPPVNVYVLPNYEAMGWNRI